MLFFVFRVLLGTVLIISIIRDYIPYVNSLDVTQGQFCIYYILVVLALSLNVMQYYWFVLLAGKAIEIIKDLRKPNKGHKLDKKDNMSNASSSDNASSIAPTNGNSLNQLRHRKNNRVGEDIASPSPKSAAVDDLARRVY